MAARNVGRVYREFNKGNINCTFEDAVQRHEFIEKLYKENGYVEAQILAHPHPVANSKLGIVVIQLEALRFISTSDCHTFVWNVNAFYGLVLLGCTKDPILAFADSQLKRQDSFDDVTAGKGNGIIMPLKGPPGV